jgi:hypothetical protein
LSDEMDLGRAAHRLDTNLVSDRQTAGRERNTAYRDSTCGVPNRSKGSGYYLPEPSNIGNRSLRAV